LTDAADSRGNLDWQLWLCGCVDQQDGLQQDVGAVGAIVPRRELVRGMADSGAAGDENHAHRRETGHHLRVVSGTAGQAQSLELQASRCLLDGRLDFRSGNGRGIVLYFF